MLLEEEIKKLENLRVGALFMEMGTGKTKIALDLMASRIKAEKCDALLWIAPAALKATMEHERDKWQPELKIQFFSCEGIAGSDRIYAEALDFVRGKEIFIVVDESLRMKNPHSKTAQHLIALGKFAKYKLILNGTPLSRNVLDVWAQMEFLSPLILKMTFRQFKDNYCTYDCEGRYKGFVRSQCNMEHLTSLIAPYVVEAKLTLDTKQCHEYYYYNQDRIDEYHNLRDKLETELELQYLDTGHVSQSSFMSCVGKLQSHYCASADRQKLILHLIEQINDKVIIFCRWLKSIPPGAHYIDGSVSFKERTKILEDFQNGKFNVLYIMLGCGAFGLNLQFCHHAIFCEQTWDYAQQLQAEARIFRTGQTENCHYYHLLCNGPGLEEKISKNLDKKCGFSESIKENIVKFKTKADLGQKGGSILAGL